MRNMFLIKTMAAASEAAELVEEVATKVISDTVGEEVKADVIKEFFSELPEKAFHFGIRVLLVVVFLFIGVQIIRILRKLVRKSMNRAGADTGAVQFVDSFMKGALYILLCFMVAASLGVDAASIVALIGSAGVAIGLAVQGSLSNIAGGVLLLLLKPFKVGDYIVDEAGMEGTVSEIGIIYTKLHTADNKMIVLPNGTLANNSIVNATAALTRRLDITVSVSYDADIRETKAVLEKVLTKDADVLPDKEIAVYVSDLGASAVIMGLRCWTETGNYWVCRWRIMENCKYALDEAGIVMAYPQLDVHIQQGE